jgi:hypothetical protein
MSKTLRLAADIYDPSSHKWFDQRSPRDLSGIKVGNPKYLEVIDLFAKLVIDNKNGCEG